MTYTVSPRGAVNRKRPSQSRSDTVSPRGGYLTKKTGVPDKIDKNPRSAFKGARARVNNHLNNQSIYPSISTDASEFDDSWADDIDWNTPVSASPVPATDPMDGLTDGSTKDISESQTADPIAVPILDDEPAAPATAPVLAPAQEAADGSMAAVQPVKEISDEELALMYHRGVKLDQLAARGKAQGFIRENTIWREVVNIVLDRATGPVGNAARYVASAVDRDAGVLVAEAVSRLNIVVKPAEDPVSNVRCEVHKETYKATSECWMCRADRLSGGVKDEVQPLSAEQIQALPEHARDMATPGFSERFAASQPAVGDDELGEDQPGEDEQGQPGLAPWDDDSVLAGSALWGTD